jgi:ribonuclease HI
VKVGRQTGIFTNWADCQKQVSGYPGAVFKSFSTQKEAQVWLSGEQPIESVSKCYIYTDGSDRRGRLGIGAWCRWKGIEYSLGKVLDVQVGSNPTAELYAFVEVLERFKNVELSVPIVFRQDYEGVEKWMTGQWKAKEVHIMELVARAKELQKTIGMGHSNGISFEWVKGHSNNEGNDRADRLAGGKDEGDNFSELVDQLRKN